MSLQKVHNIETRNKCKNIRVNKKLIKAHYLPHNETINSSHIFGSPFLLKNFS